MSYIPPNIKIPKVEEEVSNQNSSNNSNIILQGQSKENQNKNLINEEKINTEKNANINDIKLENLENKSNTKNYKKINKIQTNENIFKKEDLNKPIKNYSEEEIIHYVHLIFLNNSLYFPKRQQYLMTTENFLKIIKNLGIIPNELKLYEIDILIRIVCPKTNLITYEDFMDILIKLSEKIFPKQFKKNKSTVTNFFFHNLFLSYNEIIFDDSITLKDLIKYQYSSLVYLLNIIPDDSQILVINSLLYTLNEIYEKYFIYALVPNPNNNYFLENGNLNNFFSFCRDFEIIPFILNETQLVTYFNLVVDNNELFKFIDEPDENKEKHEGYFSFNNFILFFIHLSAYNYSKVYESILETEDKENELSKLMILLTKLECSKGMRNIIERSLPNLSLIPNRELFLKYNFDYNQENEKNYNVKNEKINEEEKNNNNNNPINNIEENGNINNK